MEVEGGDGIKGLTRLGWHMLLRQAVQPGLSGHTIVRRVCVHGSTCVSMYVTALRILQRGLCVPLLDLVSLLLMLLQLYNKAPH